MKAFRRAALQGTAMIGPAWFDRLRRAPAGSLPQGARASVTRHPFAILLQPYLHNIRGDRIVSVCAMPRGAWSVVAPDSDGTAPGAAPPAAFGMVRPGENPKLDRKARGSCSDLLRTVMGLPPRASVRKGTLQVAADVAGGAVRFTALYPHGVPGGFAGFNPPRGVIRPTPGGAGLPGRCLLDALVLAQQP
jgi:hypothetical protein